MPYTHITRTVSGDDAIAYARGNGEGHNGQEARNVFVGCVNMLPDSVVPFEKQMQPFWDRADSRHTIQVNRCIISWARSELDPDDPENFVRAGAIACEIARRNAPDNQSAIFIQNDGEGGMLHAHILTNDVNMSDYKGIDSLAYAHFHFQQITDEVCQQYFDLADPEPLPERVTPAVRGVRIKNEKIRAANELEKQRAATEGREVDPAKIRTEHYIWQDDLKRRVKEAAARSTDEEDFAHQLRLSGVELVPVTGKDKNPIRDENGNLVYLHPATKKQPEHYTYELTDVSGFAGKIPQNLKSKSQKLGTNYQPEAIAKLFKVTQAEQQATAPPAVLEIPLPSSRPSKKEDQKPAAATEKPQEKKPIDAAKDVARFHALGLMRRIYDWEEEPMMTGKDGKTWRDIQESSRQYHERDAAFDQFTRWRVDRGKELGQKLPTIYVTDKITGYVSVDRAEFEKQFTDFLDRRDHPEKYQPAQEQPEDVHDQEQAAPVQQLQQQPEQAVPMQQPHQEPPTPVRKPVQQPEQEAPPVDEKAEQERQEAAGRATALMFELIRQSDRRRAEKEAEDENTIVKS